MNSVSYLRPKTELEVSKLLTHHPEACILAGGQSLLPAWRLGFNSPSHFIDLQDLSELQTINLDKNELWIGAMATHANIANSHTIQSFCPMLNDLADGIADQQIRNVGTIGGSLANHDPSACWPAAVLALDASVITNQREIKSDLFFQGIFSTALLPSEWITGIRFPKPLFAKYLKWEQPASRFALVGAAIALLPNQSVRVALTGLGFGVVRWTEAENALQKNFHATSISELSLDVSQVQSDIHATATYRAHLAKVLCHRMLSNYQGVN